MEGLELICFNIISSVGAAKSCYMEAIECAKQGNYEEAQTKIGEGDEMQAEGHKAHMELVASECNGTPVSVSLLLVHAEDQLISAEQSKAMALEIIDLYKRIEAK